MALTELTLAQWAAAGRKPGRVEYINDATLTDVMYRIAGSPETLVINLAYFADLVDGKVAGAAIDADSLEAGQIATGAVGSDELAAGAVTDTKVSSKIVKEVGHLASGVLRAGGNYSAGDEVVIGVVTLIVEQINDDSTDTCKNGSFNNTTDPVTAAMTAADYPVIGQGGTKALIVGEIIYIGTEYLRVTVVDGNNVTFERAAAGSTAASHIDTTAIYHDALGTAAATKVPVPTQNLTVAEVTPNLVAVINENAGTDTTGANAVNAKSLASGAIMVIVADAVGVVALATTETGANTAWDAVTMQYGAAAGVKQVFTAALTPSAGEDSDDVIYLPIPFDPTIVQVFVITASTGAAVLWNGDAVINVAAAPFPAYIELNNDGATKWTANETLYVIAME